MVITDSESLAEWFVAINPLGVVGTAREGRAFAAVYHADHRPEFGTDWGNWLEQHAASTIEASFRLEEQNAKERASKMASGEALHELEEP